MERTSRLKNINVHFQLSENNLYIEANEEKLERAIKELVDNAIKYNKDQGKVILATYEEKKEIHLQISDTGIGIEKDSLYKIFRVI